MGKGAAGRDNPAMTWSERTAKKNAGGYGQYLAWLNREGLLIEDEAVTERVTPVRVASYTASLRSRLSSVSVGTAVAALCSAARALGPDADWSWLSRRSTRLKLRAKPSREKRHAIQHTLDLYRFGKRLMDAAERGRARMSPPRSATNRGSSSHCWRPGRCGSGTFRPSPSANHCAGTAHRYWLIFSIGETKMHMPVQEPLPDDLIPYLEAFLRIWRPILVRQARKFGGEPTHRRLWVDIHGNPMKEGTLRDLIKRYTRKEFGTALWPTCSVIAC